MALAEIGYRRPYLVSTVHSSRVRHESDKDVLRELTPHMDRLIAVPQAIERKIRDVGSPAFALRFSLTLVLGILFSPHLNPHDGLVLVPAAAIAYGALRTRRDGRWMGLAFFVSPFVVLLTNPLSVTEPGGPLARTPVLLMVAFAILLVVTLRSIPREAS